MAASIAPCPLLAVAIASKLQSSPVASGASTDLCMDCRSISNSNPNTAAKEFTCQSCKYPSNACTAQPTATAARLERIEPASGGWQHQWPLGHCELCACHSGCIVLPSPAPWSSSHTPCAAPTSSHAHQFPPRGTGHMQTSDHSMGSAATYANMHLVS